MELKTILSPKGTYDLFGQNAEIFLNLRKILFDTAKNFNFSYIETPIFEYGWIFKTSGENSDLVKKELYQFNDRSGRKLALRPEGTAPIIRAISQHKLHQKEQKLFYFGQMFRYENPQKGRFRQFYQAGFEITNYRENSTPYQILEIILLAQKILENLSIKNFQLKINYLADAKIREEYTKNLSNYFQKFADQLEGISQVRLKKNPLRILDDKIENQKEFVKNAPKISAFLTPEHKIKFAFICEILDKFNIKYIVDPTLVRGLDYYDEFVFEFVETTQLLGSKLTIIGGGCYNNLPSHFNLVNFRSIGMAFGIERMMEIIASFSKKKFINLDFFLLGFTSSEIEKNFSFATRLRQYNFHVELNKSPLSISKGFQKAKKSGTNFVFFYEKNQQKDCISLKNLKSGENIEINLHKIDPKTLRQKINGEANV